MAGVLDEWVNRSGLAVDAMGHFDFADALKLDQSPESLRRLSAAVREHFADPAEVLNDDEQHFVEGVVAYVGDVLLVAARGHWDWDDATHSGVPVVPPNPALDLQPVSPLHLLLAELGGEPGTIVGTVGRWQRVVEAHAATHPDWAQFTEPIPTDGVPIMPPSPILDQWLTQQRRDFPNWANVFGGTWDYTADSVDRLEALARRVTPTEEAYLDLANTEFTEGAAWYLGEMLCRVDGRWMYRPHELKPGKPRAMACTVQTLDNANFSAPFTRIWGALLGDSGALRASYDEWVDLA